MTGVKWRSMRTGWRWRCGPVAVAVLLPLLEVLTSCAIPTPGLPHVWPGQSLSPNASVRPGDLLQLTIRATNDSQNRDYGGASKVRSFTTLPPGVTLLDFTSSDKGRLPDTDQNRAWLEEIDTENRVVVVSFGPIGGGQSKTATLTLRVDAAPGASLSFRTMLIWANAAPDTVDCNLRCLDGLEAAAVDDPQVQAYVDDHRDQLAALLSTYPGGGDALANAVDVPVGDSARSTTEPAVALLLGQRERDGLRMTARGAFTPNETVMLWYNLPNGIARWINRTNALDDGSLDWVLDTADWDAIPPEATNIVARGQFSGVEALYVFNR